MIVNKYVYSFHIIPLDLAVFHSEDHDVDVGPSSVSIPEGSGLVTSF